MAGEIGVSDKCGLVIDTPMTNRDIAGLVGSTEETVSRIMSRLKKEEVLSVDGKYLIVKDKDALRSYFDAI
jgi:CRP/FNR family transcriptional regulator